MKPPPLWGTGAVRVGILLLLAIGVVYAAEMGLRFRHWMWETTATIRVTSDIERSFYWGRQAAVEGYANQYEKMQPERPTDLNWLDYPPLRLGVMTLWAKWVMTQYPQVRQWHQNPTFEMTAPLLYFNTAMEVVGVVCAFLLTRLWSRRAARRSSFILPPSSFFQGTLPGLAAAAILWFNPAVVVSGYGWPACDLWVVPMFLLATLLTSVDWWFTAGVVIGIGAMLKGQQLLAVPVFLVWALVAGRPIGAGRLLAGVTIAIALVASPSLLTYIPVEKLAAARAIQSERQPALVPDGTFAIPRVVDVRALVWIFGVVTAAIAGPFVTRLRLTPATPPPVGDEDGGSEAVQFGRHLLVSQWIFPAGTVIGIVLLVSWPWMLKSNRPHWLIGECAGVALAAATRWLRPRGIPFVAAGALGGSMLLCMSVFHGSSGWYDCGIRFGTIHWPTLAVGKTDNLPGILREHYGWADDLQATGITLPAHSIFSLWSEHDLEVSEGALLRGIFAVLLAMTAIGVGLQARRRDPRLLIAIVTPWLLFFCFLPEIHERYLLFAASLSCVCCGISTGMTLLGVLLSLVTATMTVHQMLAGASRTNLRLLGDVLNRQFPALFDRQAGQLLLRIADGTHPDLGFAVVLIGLIFLYFTLALRRTSQSLNLPSVREAVTTPVPVASQVPAIPARTGGPCYEESTVTPVLSVDARPQGMPADQHA
jgi:hypothetical protein